MRRSAFLSVLVLGFACARSGGSDALAAAPAAAPAPAPAVSPPVSGNLSQPSAPFQGPPSFAPLVQRVSPAVVSIDITAKLGGENASAEGPDDFFQRFFGEGGPQPRNRIARGAGSGFIIEARGLVLTNNHVTQNAVSIRVKLPDGRTFDGEVVGRDAPTDVALVRLKGNNVTNLPVVSLGDSDALHVGDWVVAIGNPFGLASSVSAGILSATTRQIGAGPYDDFLQTDAAINPGNSGGPLFNLKGEVVGINTAIVNGGSGIGFAVPANLVKALLPQLEKSGGVTRGSLGAFIQDLTPELAQALGVQRAHGAIITGFTGDDAPGHKAGLKQDDVVVGLDGKPVDSSSGLSRSVALRQPGSDVTLTVVRGGKQQDVRVKLGTRTDLEGSGPLRGNGAERGGGAVGLQLRDLTPQMAAQLGTQGRGAVVTGVAPGSPADRANIPVGSVIIEVDREKVSSAADVVRRIRAKSSGSTILLRLTQPGANGASVLAAVAVP